MIELSNPTMLVFVQLSYYQYPSFKILESTLYILLWEAEYLE